MGVNIPLSKVILLMNANLPRRTVHVLKTSNERLYHLQANLGARGTREIRLCHGAWRGSFYFADDSAIYLLLLYIRYWCAYSVFTNCINFVIAILLYCWPLYVKYSYNHFIPITLILLPPHRCTALHHCSSALLYHCIDVRQMVSYLYTHSAIYCFFLLSYFHYLFWT